MHQQSHRLRSSPVRQPGPRVFLIPQGNVPPKCSRPTKWCVHWWVDCLSRHENWGLDKTKALDETECVINFKSNLIAEWIALNEWREQTQCILAHNTRLVHQSNWCQLNHLWQTSQWNCSIFAQQRPCLIRSTYNIAVSLTDMELKYSTTSLSQRERPLPMYWPEGYEIARKRWRHASELQGSPRTSDRFGRETRLYTRKDPRNV